MKVAVFGLGYVGTVTAALLAEQGNTVVGVDINPAKVEMIQRGLSPVIEPELPERIAAAVKSGNLTAVCDPTQIHGWKVAFICVGTPSGTGGQMDTSALRAVLIQIGRQIQQRSDFMVVALRSTVLPHILRKMVIPSLIQECGDPPGERYGLVVMPEFLREGCSVVDFLNPPFILIGESEARAGDIVEELFQFVAAPVLRMRMEGALMVKYASNAFHALKVAFANEIGLLCACEGMDSAEVMGVFCRDTKLNISSSYLSPGFAFGGSCLPKDLRALNRRARQLDVDTPLLGSILSSNRSYLEHCIDVVLATKRQRIGILGLGFKAGTDDLRESPVVLLAEALLGKGKQISLYDHRVSLSLLTGANREFIERTIPHIASLLRPSIGEVLQDSEVIVIGNRDPEFDTVELRTTQILIEFGKGCMRQKCSISPQNQGLISCTKR
jgi:GDP-mannose 6-dehydrogenase